MHTRLHEEDETEVVEETASFRGGIRKIGLYGQIEEERCAEVIYLLLSLYEGGKIRDEDGNQTIDPIELIISTWGGAAVDMFAVYDIIRLLREDCNIGTFGLGKVMSAGVLLLAAGTPGKRRIGRHCRVMIHSVVSGHMGELHDLENELEEAQETQKQYIKALASETHMSQKYIKNLLNKKINVYLTAQQAVDLGIADEVV